jgi:L,D-transpeptidase YcbB
MHGRSVVLSAGGLALALAVSVTAAVATEPDAAAEHVVAAPDVTGSLPKATQDAPAAAAVVPGASTPAAAPTGAAPDAASALPLEAAATPPPEADPVVANIRAKLADASAGKGATASDLAALRSFYAQRDSGPVWTTPMGFSARAQAAIDEIADADDWGLSAQAFALPPAGGLPETVDQQASAEIKLQLAILQYARFARGGRADPSSLSKLIDQSPPLLDPSTVLADVATAPAPDAYLQSLHPKHEQFQLLRQALLKARGGDKNGGNVSDIQRILINMERWRWMPADLGRIYVQDNVPEFMLYIVKDGKRIHADKIVVGQLRYATPIFSADMRTIVFNPEWTVPPTIVRENLLPNLRGGGWFGGSSILREHGLRVRYNGRVVDPSSINWSSVNMANIAFTQAPGPTNVLGKLKFLYPNSHMVYMHDTIKKGLFTPAVRAEGHNCIRMADPPKLAQILLTEDKGWDSAKVKNLLDHGDNSAVALDHPVPVHTTYFTAVADADGKVTSFADIYGLDKKVAPALLGKSLPAEPSAAVADAPQAEAPAAPAESKPKTRESAVASGIQGLFGD